MNSSMYARFDNLEFIQFMLARLLPSATCAYILRLQALQGLMPPLPAVLPVAAAVPPRPRAPAHLGGVCRRMRALGPDADSTPDTGGSTAAHFPAGHSPLPGCGL